ncbi:MAG: hypothetical protein IKI64_09230 [Clostridia bacterium]|nr:hypothetical protein [Clostridia bacterium]
MFINSPELLERINKVSDDINKRSGGLVVFEEYIAVPIFGFVTLRFELLSEEVTLAELDGYERLMQEAAGDEFQVDLMGSVYKRAGVSLQAMQARFARCFEAYEGETIAPSPYADRIRADAAALLKLFSLPEDTPVWEIQVNDELDVLVFGDERKEPRRYRSDGLAVNLFTLSPADRLESEGLVRALFYAKRNGISLASAVMRVSEPNG